MEFSFGQHDEGDFTLGLHHQGRYDAVFDLHQCHLQSEVSNRLIDWFRQWVRDQNVPVYHMRRHEGMMRFYMIRQTTFTDQLMINIVTNYGEISGAQAMVEAMTAAFPEITTIVHNQNGQKSNIAVGEIETILYGPGYMEEELMGSRFRIRSNSFFQTNSRQAEVLYRLGFEMLKASPTDRVLDLYCGTGTIGLLLAPEVAEVVGVELVADAVADARFNAGRNGIDNISFFEGNVKDLLQSGTPGDGFDAVIVDPPRAGINPKALNYLIAMNAPKLLYISCNPATFARDAARLCENGYALPEVQPVDMFPHTMHIELVGLFTRS
ncbi:MAG: 23S rRNA (uracil(1939)-C(5))-methyltransferase RlmD [bacterium]